MEWLATIAWDGWEENTAPHPQDLQAHTKLLRSRRAVGLSCKAGETDQKVDGC